jgi:hypothetical protein
MFGQLGLQPPFEHRLGHLPQQPALAEQLHALVLSPRDQLIGQSPIDEPRLVLVAPTTCHVRSACPALSPSRSRSSASR